MIKNYSYTLRWYIVVAFTIMVAVTLGGTGVLGAVWTADVTKLSFLIMGIFSLASFKCGHDLVEYERTGRLHDREVELGWFISETLLALGMTGTVIGFIIIMKDFAFLDVQDVSSVEALIKSLGSGVSTALYTTLFGLATSILLKIQYFLLEDAKKKKEKDE